MTPETSDNDSVIPAPDDPAGPVTPPDPTEDDEELPLPTGTLFFIMIYLMVMAGMWGAIYFDFLGR